MVLPVLHGEGSNRYSQGLFSCLAPFVVDLSNEQRTLSSRRNIHLCSTSESVSASDGHYSDRCFTRIVVFDFVE